MQLKYLPFLSCLLLTVGVTANVLAEPSPKPEKCPSVSAVQSVGLDEVQPSRSGGWTATKMSPENYDTKDHWIFMLLDVDAENRDDALNQARKSLTTLSFDHGPTENGIAGWMCTYVTADAHLGWAISLRGK